MERSIYFTDVHVENRDGVRCGKAAEVVGSLQAGTWRGRVEVRGMWLTRELPEHGRFVLRARSGEVFDADGLTEVPGTNADFTTIASYRP